MKGLYRLCKYAIFCGVISLLSADIITLSKFVMSEKLNPIESSNVFGLLVAGSILLIVGMFVQSKIKENK